MGLETQEMSLQDIAGVLKKRWNFILIPSIIVLIVSYLAVQLIDNIPPKTYQSYALIKIGRIGNRPIESISSTQEIMKSHVMLLGIAKALKYPTTPQNLDELKKDITYKESSEFMKVISNANSPEEAYKKTKIVSEVIVERHSTLLAEAALRIKRLLAEARTSLSLLGNVSELTIEPTAIIIDPMIDPSPVNSHAANIISLSAFFVVLLITTLFAFYQEGKERNKS